MPSSRRIEKINNLLREELSKIIVREIEFPAGLLVTVTRVITSPDGHYATVFFSVLENKETKTQSDNPRPISTKALDVLEKNVYDIQKMINRKLRMRPIPKIVFAYDVGEERREGVERSLVELKNEGKL